MKVAIMQPYLFPYLGYFQLIHLVDNFIIFDDVQFIKRGWINRNRILYNNEEYMFTFAVRKASRDLHINQRYYSDIYESEKSRFYKLIAHAYKKAPFYTDVCNLLEDILECEERNVALFNGRSIQKICAYLDIETTFMYSSQVSQDNTLKGQARIIQLAKSVDGSTYINPIGGVSLYSNEEFKVHSLNLTFLKMKDISYKQFDSIHTPFLSIIDVLMFNSPQTIKTFLGDFELS